MPELPRLLLALAAFGMVVSLLGALRRAGREATAYAGLLVAGLGLCGLAWRRGAEGPMLWAALALFTLLVVVPRLLATRQSALLRAGDLPGALQLQLWRSHLQPGAHQVGLRVLRALASQGSERPAAPGWWRQLLTEPLEPAVRLALLEASFAELSAAGRGEELFALLENEGRVSLLQASPRIAATLTPWLMGSEPSAESGGPPASVEQLATPSSGPRQTLWSQAPVSLIAIALIGAVHLLFGRHSGEESWTLLRLGGNYGQATLHGEPWRLLTSIFLHGGWLHLLVNSYAVYSLGRFVEPLFGSTRLILIFVLTGLGGAAASTLLGGADRLSVGASGAIFGLLGAALILLVRLRGIIHEGWRRQITFNLLIVIALNLYIGYQLPVVDNWAHLGGLGTGVLLGLLLRPRAAHLKGGAPGLPVRLLAAALVLACLVAAAATALTPIEDTLQQMPRRNLERGGLRVEVPARLRQEPGSPGLTLSDPLARAQIELGVDLAASDRPLEEELVVRLAALRQELTGRAGLSGLVALPVDSAPALAPEQGVQGLLQGRLDRQPIEVALVLRRQGEVVLEMRVLGRRGSLEHTAAELRRLFASLRYQRVSGPGT